jgi:hypothetical protein
MPRPATLRCLAVVAALAPVWAALSVVAAPPAFGVAPTTRSATLAALAQFNDDCSRANAPDECLQQQVNDDCTRAHPPDECTATLGGVQAFKSCHLVSVVGDVCLVVVFNGRNRPLNNVTIKDVLPPGDFVVDGFAFVFTTDGPSPVFNCAGNDNTAQCSFGTLQPGQGAAMFVYPGCPPTTSGGTNKAVITAGGRRFVRTDTFTCGEF